MLNETGGSTYIDGVILREKDDNSSGGGTDFNSVSGGSYDVRVDLNMDGNMDFSDYLVFLNEYGTGEAGGRGVLFRPSNANRTGYAGYQHSPELFGTKWHVRHRVLDSERGRWISRDLYKYIDGMSLSQYVQSKPVKTSDAPGLYSCCICGDITYALKPVYETQGISYHGSRSLFAFIPVLGTAKATKPKLAQLDVKNGMIGSSPTVASICPHRLIRRHRKRQFGLRIQSVLFSNQGKLMFVKASIVAFILFSVIVAAGTGENPPVANEDREMAIQILITSRYDSSTASVKPALMADLRLGRQFAGMEQFFPLLRAQPINYCMTPLAFIHTGSSAEIELPGSSDFAKSLGGKVGLVVIRCRPVGTNALHDIIFDTNLHVCKGEEAGGNGYKVDDSPVASFRCSLSLNGDVVAWCGTVPPVANGAEATAISIVIGGSWVE